MKTNLKLRKALMLSLGLALMLLVPKTTTAQYGGENDFFAMDETILEEYFAVDNTYGMNDFGSVFDGISNLMEAIEYDRSVEGLTVNTQDFGTPLGSGIIILLAAGAGYAALKRKEEQE